MQGLPEWSEDGERVRKEGRRRGAGRVRGGGHRSGAPPPLSTGSPAGRPGTAPPGQSRAHQPGEGRQYSATGALEDDLFDGSSFLVGSSHADCAIISTDQESETAFLHNGLFLKNISIDTNANLDTDEILLDQSTIPKSDGPEHTIRLSVCVSCFPL